MLDVVKTPLARRLWRICKQFNLLPSDPRIKSLNEFDMEFIEYSIIADDPNKLKQLSETFYDPEFEDYWNENE